MNYKGRDNLDENNEKGLIGKTFHLADENDIEIAERFGISDFPEKHLYVIKVGGDVAGAVVLSNKQPAEYGQIVWGIRPKSKDVLVMHKLEIAPDYIGKGITLSLLLFVERLAVRRRAKVIRFDSSIKENFIPTIFEKQGYNLVGSLDDFEAYEKIIFPWADKKLL